MRKLRLKNTSCCVKSEFGNPAYDNGYEYTIDGGTLPTVYCYGLYTYNGGYLPEVNVYAYAVHTGDASTCPLCSRKYNSVLTDTDDGATGFKIGLQIMCAKNKGKR
jgi:hypothetical protein